MTMENAERGVGIRVRNLWKVFMPEGRRRGRGALLGKRSARRNETLLGNGGLNGSGASDGSDASAGGLDPERVTELERQGAVVAVRDVSFDVAPGELFVVMGLSGSGKSTLIRCLLRLVEPTAGTITCGHHEVTALGPKELTEFRRTQVAMVFQHYGLLPHRTVLDNVAFGLKLRGVPREERYELARAALERVGLAGWEARYPSELSGGMQQRVGIARALANDPPVMLWDEPFSGLDPLIRREMQDELIRLQRELRKTIVFVTHDLDEAVRLGDRMAVMRSGSFVQVGTPEEIIENPADDYVRRFVHARPVAAGSGSSVAVGPNGSHRIVETGANGRRGSRADGRVGEVKRHVS